MTYTPDITLSRTSFAVDEGDTATLSITSDIGDQTISWRSSAQAVATVSDGVVTAIKAGQTVITASTPDGVSGSCLVYVTVTDGIYYIKNFSSNYYMSAQDGMISTGTRIIQTSKTGSTADRLWQIWRIRHLANGQYSVRPLHKLDMGLGYSATPALLHIGTTDTYSSTTSYAQWTIKWATNGYVFTNCEKKGYSLCTSSSTDDGAYINAASGTVANVFCWTLESTYTSPKLMLHTFDTGCRTENTRRGISPGLNRSLTDINLVCAVSSSSSIDQSVTWTSLHPSIATVDSSTGAITGVAKGSTTISGSAIINGISYSASYTLVVSEIPISGSELEYEPSLWNISSVMPYVNCYSYAFNNQMNWMNPGSNSIGTITQASISRENILTYIQADAAQLGFVFEEIAYDACCTSGSYKVALVIDPGTDYHWYRQNPDGTWSHKPGRSAVVNHDASGQLIYNPQIANRDYSDINYTDFVGFYRITPLNYTVSTTAQASTQSPVQTSLRYISFNEGKSELPDYSCTSTVCKGMTYSEVTSIIGEPQRQITFGVTVVEYDISNGGTLVVEYVLGDSQYIVHSLKYMEVTQ